MGFFRRARRSTLILSSRMIEQLETRAMFDTARWTFGGELEKFSDPNNWSIGRVPGANDEVVFGDAGGGVLNVKLDAQSPPAVQSLTVEQGEVSLDLAGRTLALTSAGVPGLGLVVAKGNGSNATLQLRSSAAGQGTLKTAGANVASAVNSFGELQVVGITLENSEAELSVGSIQGAVGRLSIEQGGTVSLITMNNVVSDLDVGLAGGTGFIELLGANPSKLLAPDGETAIVRRNRQNCLKSTGPKAGKAIAKANRLPPSARQPGLARRRGRTAVQARPGGPTTWRDAAGARPPIELDVALHVGTAERPARRFRRGG